MQTRWSRAIILGVAALSCVAVTATAVQAGQQSADAQGAGAGQAAFAKAGCAACHGERAGGTAAAPPIAGTSRLVNDFIAYVRKPAGTMPPVGPQTASDAMLRDIHAFLRAMPAAAASQAASAAPAGDVARGGTLYRRYGCYQCHSNEAQGGLQGPRLGPNPVPFARFSSYVRHPTNDMPPYTDKVVSDQDLADIYAWIAARPAPPPISNIPLLAP